METKTENQKIAERLFKSSDVQRSCALWVSGHPDSFMSYDVGRWVKFVLSALEAEESIDIEKISKAFNLKLDKTEHGDSNMLDTLETQYFAMKNLYGLMLSSGYSKGR